MIPITISYVTKKSRRKAGLSATGRPVACSPHLWTAGGQQHPRLTGLAGSRCSVVGSQTLAPLLGTQAAAQSRRFHFTADVVRGVGSQNMDASISVKPHHHLPHSGALRCRTIPPPIPSRGGATSTVGGHSPARGRPFARALSLALRLHLGQQGLDPFAAHAWTRAFNLRQFELARLFLYPRQHQLCLLPPALHGCDRRALQIRRMPSS